MTFEMNESQDGDFNSVKLNSNLINSSKQSQLALFDSVRKGSGHRSSQQRPVRASTALHGSRSIHNRRERQDLNFNARPEVAE